MSDCSTTKKRRSAGISKPALAAMAWAEMAIVSGVRCPVAGMRRPGGALGSRARPRLPSGGAAKSLGRRAFHRDAQRRTQHARRTVHVPVHLEPHPRRQRSSHPGHGLPHARPGCPAEVDAHRRAASEETAAHVDGHVAPHRLGRNLVRHQVQERRWRIVDRLSGTGTHRAVLRLHLHPEVHAKVVTPNVVQLRRPGGALRLQCSEPLELTDGWVSPRYGVKLPARVLVVRRSGQLPFAITTDIAWAPV